MMDRGCPICQDPLQVAALAEGQVMWSCGNSHCALYQCRLSGRAVGFVRLMGNIIEAEVSNE